jgi:hypothetical protein
MIKHSIILLCKQDIFDLIQDRKFKVFLRIAEFAKQAPTLKKILQHLAMPAKGTGSPKS